ncbi:MAG: hypothetical protein J0I20_19715 [Chloroflexi bacterium]|nr:hypothetical protein [Chloroflexota bacterium]OJW06288.1 MAG: hypothetical protein BGO39_25995 [Chloroflexi bacterium 54-19]
MSESTTKENEIVSAVTAPSSGWLSRWGDWLAFFAYALLALAFTWPLVLQMDTNLRAASGTGDAYQNIWYMWWYGHALELGVDPSRSNLMYGLLPDVQVLVSSILNGLLMWPVIKLFGALTAYNFALLISFPLAGFFTYKLALEVLSQRAGFTWNRLAAFAAGFFFAFSNFHYARTEGHLGLLTIQWLPFYLWMLFRLRRHPSYLNAALVALGCILAALSDLYYLGYFVLPVTVAFVAWFGAAEWQQFWRWKTNLKYYVVALVVAGAVLLFFYRFFLSLDPDIRQSVGDASTDVRSLSANLLAYFFPSGTNPLFGGLTAPIYNTFQTPFLIEENIFPGYVLYILAFGGLFFKKIQALSSEVYFWLTLAVFAFVFSLGPHLHVAGFELDFPALPYSITYGKFPFLGNFRAPSRMSVIVVLALAILAAFCLALLLEKLPGWLALRIKARKARRFRLLLGRPVAAPVLVAVLLALSLAETLPYGLPFKTAPVETPQIYREIAATPGDFKVLELPLNTNSQPLYYQILHQKPLVGGLATRISNRMTVSWDQATYLGMFNPAESSAVISNGYPLKVPGGPDIFPIDITFRQMLDEEGIGFVTFRSERADFAWMRDYLIQQLGQPKYTETLYGEPLLGWNLLPLGKNLPGDVAAGKFRIRLGDGWDAGLGTSDNGQLLRLVQQDAQFLVTPGTPGKYNFYLTVTPYIQPQAVEIYLNGKAVGRIEGKTPWKAVPAFLPLDLLPGKNVIQLRSTEGCLHPVDYIPNSTDQRCISFAVQNVSLK